MKYRKKNIILLLITIALLYFSWKFAIQNTLEQSDRLNDLKLETEKLSDINQRLMFLKKKEVVLDSIFKAMNIYENLSLEEEILKELGKLSDTLGTVLLEFKPPHKINVNTIEKRSYTFFIQGNYTQLLKTIYHFEQTKSFGEIIYFKIQPENPKKNKWNVLNAEIIIQNAK